ncbi:very short patch repair endonuclease [Arthrobacter castelli]|uniref:very short patch repair endonuclease n=1 Tax=Arthrobacter castelli TaxID=271431 RepID=UPI00047D3244|nr:very short patch repair endonuclease [Arthrobacter castelli]
MADSLSPQRRSWNMSRIRGKNTKPEMTVRRLLHGAGYRYRLHDKHLPGKPDLVFAGRRKVIFVHGCFWHSHSCKAGEKAPAQNAEFWAAKRTRTLERDAGQLEQLLGSGWDPLVIWECELKDQDALLERVTRFLRN